MAHLAVEINSKSARFVVLQGEQSIYSSEIELNEFSADSCREALKSKISETPELQRDFTDVTVGWAGRQSTLVPNDIFAESAPEHFMHLCFGKEVPKNEIDFNRLFECGIVNIYQIPNWIKSFFIIKYPTALIQHEVSHLIRSNLKNGFELKVTASVHDDHFHLLISKHNEIIYSASFDHLNSNDILYHLTFVLQQKELTTEKGKLEVGFSSGVPTEFQDKLKADIKKVRDLSQFDLIETDFHNAKAQLLCV